MSTRAFKKWVCSSREGCRLGSPWQRGSVDTRKCRCQWREGEAEEKLTWESSLGMPKLKWQAEKRHQRKLEKRSRGDPVWKPRWQRESSSLTCPWEVRQDTGRETSEPSRQQRKSVLHGLEGIGPISGLGKKWVLGKQKIESLFLMPQGYAGTLVDGGSWVRGAWIWHMDMWKGEEKGVGKG